MRKLTVQIKGEICMRKANFFNEQHDQVKIKDEELECKFLTTLYLLWNRIQSFKAQLISKLKVEWSPATLHTEVKKLTCLSAQYRPLQGQIVHFVSQMLYHPVKGRDRNDSMISNRNGEDMYYAPCSCVKISNYISDSLKLQLLHTCVFF